MTDEPHDGLDDRAIAEFISVSNASNALFTAWLRCEGTDILIASLSDLPDPGSYYTCRVLSERVLSDGDRQLLARQVATLLSDDFRQTTPTRSRSRLDRILLHTGQLMDSPDARSLAQDQLQHRLPQRRRTAIRVLHRLGIDKSDLLSAHDALATFGDLEAISILALIEDGLAGFSCCALAGACDTDRDPPFGDPSYLGAVALQGLASQGTLDHQHACESHPLIYIRAAGRLRDTSLAGYLRTSIRVGGPSVWPMAVSVAGRLQLADLLKEIEAEIQRHIRSAPEFFE